MPQPLIPNGFGGVEGLHTTGPEIGKGGIRAGAIFSQALLGQSELSSGIEATTPQIFADYTPRHIRYIMLPLRGRRENAYSPCHRRFRARLALSTPSPALGDF